jgi:hypothetical protein
MDLKTEIREYFYTIHGSHIETDIANIIAIAEKHIALQLQQTGVVCSLCDGNGYTIEVEAECCRNFNDYGCCGVPDPVQVQKQCYCSGGELPI